MVSDEKNKASRLKTFDGSNRKAGVWPKVGAHLCVAATYVHDAVAQRVQQLHGAGVVPLTVLHHGSAYGHAHTASHLMLLILARFPVQQSSRFFNKSNAFCSEKLFLRFEG